MASKTLAEKAAWEFFDVHKSEISCDLVVVDLPFIFCGKAFFLPLFSLKLKRRAYFQPSLSPGPTANDINASI